MAYRQWAEVTDRTHRPEQAAVILVLIQDLGAGGWFVRGYDRTGRETTETWHGGLPSAREWAVAEYSADTIGAWHDIPDETQDPVRYALRKRR
ncbi:MAG TPA: hypothetical protein VF337_01025 [Candidatus Limnocylindrales bacterium]